MDGVFWGTLGDTLTALEADASVHGIIFSSGLKRDVFTAGNDLTELYMPVRVRWNPPHTPAATYTLLHASPLLHRYLSRRLGPSQSLSCGLG